MSKSEQTTELSLPEKDIQDLVEHVEKNNIPPFDAFIGYKIKSRRKALKYSQQQLAFLLNLTFQQVQKYEKGINRITAERLWELAHIFNVDYGYFFEGIMPFLSKFQNSIQLPVCYEIAKNTIDLQQDSIFTVIEKLDSFLEKRPYDANKPICDIVKDLNIQVDTPDIYEQFTGLSPEEITKKYAELVDKLPREEQKRFENAALYFQGTPQESLCAPKKKKKK